MREHILRLPARFVADRLERDLTCGEVSRVGTQFVVFADEETLTDMLSDADYQARWTDTEDRSLKKSAARACDILTMLFENEGIALPRLG